MENQLTIVMYHYVRGTKTVRYPIFKDFSITAQQFEKQLEFFQKHYNIISPSALLEALETAKILPPDAVLLTFDDGYREHYDNVFPLLRARGLSGCFFPCAKPVLEGKMLDTNKLQIILALEPDKKALENKILHMAGLLHGSRSRSGGDVNQIKRLLMRELPAEIRGKIIDSLYARYFGVPGENAARELYMGVSELRQMAAAGMYIGCHSYSHGYMDLQTPEMLQKELDISLEMLHLVDADTEPWIMCYPYGAYGSDLLSMLPAKGCRAALCTVPRIADLHRDSPFALPRLDGNNFLAQSDCLGPGLCKPM